MLSTLSSLGSGAGFGATVAHPVTITAISIAIRKVVMRAGFAVRRPTHGPRSLGLLAADRPGEFRPDAGERPVPDFVDSRGPRAYPTAAMSGPPLSEVLRRLETEKRARAVGLHSAARGWVLSQLRAKLK